MPDLSLPRPFALLIAVSLLATAPAMAAPPQAALTEAVQAGRLEVVSGLIAAGADVNGRDGQGQTALMWAVSTGNAAMVRLLLDRGADRHARSRYGRSAVDMARGYNQADVLAAFGEQAKVIALYPRPVATFRPGPRPSAPAAAPPLPPRAIDLTATSPGLKILAAGTETLTYLTPLGEQRVVAIPGPRNPWLAGSLSAIVPGAGEVANGDAWLGGSLLAANVALFVLNAYTAPAYDPAFLAARIGLNAGSAIGAAWRAAAINADRDALLAIPAPGVATPAQQELLEGR